MPGVTWEKPPSRDAQKKLIPLRIEERPVSSCGQPLGRLNAPFMEGPGQDGLPQELLISPPSSSAPPAPRPDPARPPETLT